MGVTITSKPSPLVHADTKTTSPYTHSITSRMTNVLASIVKCQHCRELQFQFRFWVPIPTTRLNLALHFGGTTPFHTYKRAKNHTAHKRYISEDSEYQRASESGQGLVQKILTKSGTFRIAHGYNIGLKKTSHFPYPYLLNDLANQLQT